MAAEGHRCDTCAWTLRPGTDVDQHNSGLLHWTLLDASARLTLEEFGRFRERVALDGPKKGISNCILQNIGVSVRVPGSSGIFATDSMRQVIGLGHATSHKGQNKGTYPNFHDFRELREDCMLIHHGEMVAILLHGFVASTEASEHIQTLGYLFQYGDTISRSCSRKSNGAVRA
ncbi:unnamed protein product [Sphagnum troendelagicum]